MHYLKIIKLCGFLVQAVQEYQAQIMSVGAQLLQQYEQMFGAAFVPGARPLDPATQEQRKTQLFGELNCSGKYFAFKEQMKVTYDLVLPENIKVQNKAQCCVLLQENN